MKQFTLLLIGSIAISSTLMAESYPAYGPNSYKELYETPNSYDRNSATNTSDEGGYIGLGYSYINANLDELFMESIPVEADISGNAFTIVAGYTFNKYITLEGRHSLSVDDVTYDIAGADSFDADGEMSNFALYIKPTYSIDDDVGVYALLGYGKLTYKESGVEDESEDGFQWGIGANINVNNYVEIYADYTRLYDDSEGFNLPNDGDILVQAWTVGLNVKF